MSSWERPDNIEATGITIVRTSNIPGTVDKGHALDRDRAQTVAKRTQHYVFDMSRSRVLPASVCSNQCAGARQAVD
jgi:hypothetical protein